MKYASNTEVSSDRSRSEIERTLTRYGAKSFAYGWQDGRAVIQFEMSDRSIRFVLPLPTEQEFSATPAGRARRGAAMQQAYQQAVRQRWRALALSIKAKLESVESQIETFEDAFMAQIVLPSGMTVGDHMRGQIADAYETGTMPPLLPAPGKRSM
jgi:hypothetical protein